MYVPPPSSERQAPACNGLLSASLGALPVGSRCRSRRFSTLCAAVNIFIECSLNTGRGSRWMHLLTLLGRFRSKHTINNKQNALPTCKLFVDTILTSFFGMM